MNIKSIDNLFFLDKAKYGYICPLCHKGKSGYNANGEAGDGQGLYIDKRNPDHLRWTCFSSTCNNKRGDICDWYGWTFNKSARQSYIDICNYFNGNPEEIKKYQYDNVPVDKKPSGKECIVYDDISSKLNYFHDLAIQHNIYNMLNPYIVNKYKLGFMPKVQKWVIPVDNTCYVTRQLEVPKHKRYRFNPVGHERRMFNYQAITGNKPIFITEGEKDALAVLNSLHELNLHDVSCVALGGAGAGTMYRFLMNNEVNNTFIILTDNDDKGDVIKNKLINDVLSVHKVKYITPDITSFYESFKDCWEIMEQNKGLLNIKIHELVKKSLHDLNQIK